MRKLFALLTAVLMLAMCVPAAALGTRDVNPIGQNISNVHAAYITAGGNPSTTDFLTAEDFAAHTITIINVWSNGCGPCINEMPYFQQVEEELGHDGEVLIVGCCSLWIGGSYSAEWTFLQQHGYTYMNVIQDDVLYGLYSQNNYVPQTFFIDSEGTVVDFIGGGTSYNVLVNKITQHVGHYFPDVFYDVSFVNGLTGEVFETQNVHAGDTPVYPEPPEMEGYSFQGWDPATPPVISGPTTITANYSIRTFRVRFFDSITGEKIGSNVYVQYGNPVTPPEAPEHEGYVFVGWDHDLSCVTEAMDVYTIYEEEGTQPQPVVGDLDGDGELSATDALLILRGSMGIIELTPEQEEIADFNGDGYVNLTDALLVLRVAMGVI